MFQLCNENDVILRKKESLITTFSIFQINKGKKLWAFGQMATFPRKLTSVDGLSTFKMMGSGDGVGFSIKPNFGVYTLLAVWDTEEQADQFFDSQLFSHYKDGCAKVESHYLKCYKTHGLWNKNNPFLGKEVDRDLDKNIAVITRATIKLSKMHRFWKHVPKTSKEIVKAKGRSYSIGVGELPWIQQATFSIWESEEAMKAYAYHSKEHLAAIRMTKELGWYKEEMFSRFNLVKTTKQK